MSMFHELIGHAEWGQYLAGSWARPMQDESIMHHATIEIIKASRAMHDAPARFFGSEG